MPATYGDIYNDLAVPVKVYTDRGDSAQEALTKSAVGWTGKNKLQIPASVVTTEYTGTNVTYTVTRDANGEVIEVDIDTNGLAATTTLNFQLWGTEDSPRIPTGEYILSGCPNNGSSTTCKLYWYNRKADDSGWDNIINDYSEGAVINRTDDRKYFIGATIYSGAVLDHAKFYPMLRDARIKDSTFEPYHESVKEFTDTVLGEVTTTFTKAQDAPTEVKRNGKVVECDLNITGVTATGGSTAIATIPEGFRPPSAKYVTCTATGAASWCIFATSGNVLMGSNVTDKNIRVHTTWLLD